MDKNGGLLVELIKTILSIIISVSTVLGIFTGIINKLFNDKLEPIEEKVEKNRVQSIRGDMALNRYQVVRFASELHRGVPKTRYEFESIADICDAYEQAVEELGIKNNFFTAEEEYIKECYHRLCEEENKNK